MFYVVSPRKQEVKEAEAVVAYGWESPELYVRWLGDVRSGVDVP